MTNWMLLADALMQSIAFTGVIYFAIWLDMRLERNIQQGLAVSD